MPDDAAAAAESDEIGCSALKYFSVSRECLRLRLGERRRG